MNRSVFPPIQRAILLLLTGFFLLPACKKCETCSYKYDVGNGQQETYTFPEVCGSKNDREAQESACQTAARLAGTTCTCVNS
ncbi:MAG: hypothetical protein QY325_11810 [Flavobacteriales bacterium]|nr:MAG: hypothetical protein QY325_11810 [Flavobacteriales bacterium]